MEFGILALGDGCQRRAPRDGRGFRRLDGELARDQLDPRIGLQQRFHARLGALGEAAIVIEELDDGDVAIGIAQEAGRRVMQQGVHVLCDQLVAGGGLVGVDPGLIGLLDAALVGRINRRGEGRRRGQQQDSKQQRSHDIPPVQALCLLPGPACPQLPYQKRDGQKETAGSAQGRKKPADP